MTIVEQVMLEIVQLAARNLGSSESGTATAPTLVLSTDATTSPTPAPTQQSQPNTTQSPLLFFVALGFGVVFTNLWIIVGVKYCFRYNARNRALARGEDGEPINLENMPRPHRRRREKKLMSMDEVNDSFPLTKYKTWIVTRTREGLPTAGGVAASVGKDGESLNGPEGATPSSPIVRKDSDEERPASTTLNDPTPEASNLPAMNAKEVPDGRTRSMDDGERTPIEADTMQPPAPGIEMRTVAVADVGKADEDDEDEDDHIHDALPPELLATPGDSCAICIDSIEEDDDIRGLTCGHAFHASCLDPWLTSRRACCPLCKADYFIPKPRPEGEPPEGERPRRPGRMNLPVPPSSAWTGARGNPRLIFPGRFMSSPPYRGGGYNFHQSDRRTRRQARRTPQRNQSVGPVQPVSPADDTAASPSRSLIQRIGLANPFRTGWMPTMRSPGRAGRAQNTAAHEAASPPAAELESVVVR